MVSTAVETFENENSTLKNATKGYARFIIFYICAYTFMDGYLTGIPTFINANMTYEFGLDYSGYFFVLSIASLGLVAVFALQALADVIGRKPAIIISFIGMGASGLYMALAPNLMHFTIAFFLSFMFISSDAWVILVAEEGSKEKRGKIVMWTWILSVVATFMGPITRILFMQNPVDLASAATWRFLPMILMIAIPLGLLGVRMKESNAWLTRKAQPQEAGVNKLSKLRLVWVGEHRRRMLAFVLAGIFFGLLFASISSFDRFLFDYYGEKKMVDNTFIIMSFFAMASYLIVGPACDKFGRKKVSAGLGLTMLAAVIFLVGFVDWGWTVGNNFVIIAVLSGITFGTYHSFSGLNRVQCMEMFPTTIRGTALGWRSFIYALGVLGGALLGAALVTVVSLGTLFIIYSAVVLAVLYVNHKVLPETKKISIA